MAVNLSPVAGAAQQFFTNSGIPLAGGLLYTYAAGTTTPTATYTDNTGGTPNSNPIVLDSAGRVPNEIWMTSGTSYKLVLKDSTGVTIGTWDNIVASTNATNLLGGAAGQVPWQSAANTTGFVSAGTSGQVFTSGGSGTPTWTSQSALTAGNATKATNIAGGAAGRIPYQSATDTTGFAAVGTAGQYLVSGGTGSPTWQTVTQIRTRTLTSGTTYTLPSDVSAIFVIVGGATGGYSSAASGGVGGGGYAEWYSATPAASYTYAIGAAGANTGTAGGTTTFSGTGVSISVTGSGGVTTTAGSTGGVASFVTGSGFTANGGSGGNGSGTGGAGGGGGAGGSRAGAGGNGAAGVNNTTGGGGGGTGGNASGVTAGIAATTRSASVVAMPTLDNYQYSFSAGSNGTSGTNPLDGGSGAAGTETLGSQPISYVSGANNGSGSKQQSLPSTGLAGASGFIYIVEYLK